MLSFESDTRPLSECSNPVASSPAQIVEIHCASVSQRTLQTELQNTVSIVTLKQREQLALNDGFSPELHFL